MGSDIFKALGDPNRRKILEILSSEGDMTAGEIASRFDISAPSVSHHLAILKKADLITDTKQRQSIIYSINTTVFQEAVKWFFDILGSSGKEGRHE